MGNPGSHLFDFDHLFALRPCASVFVALLCVALSAAPARATTTKLGTTNVVEAPSAGNDSVLLALDPSVVYWTATTGSSWLHLNVANQIGTGSTNVIFTFDANLGPTRTGTLTIAGQTISVTQAGSTYSAANPVTTLVSLGFNFPNSVVVDGGGNVYAPSFFYNLIEKWSLASNTVTTLVSSGLSSPVGLAMDGAGNLYIGDYGDNALKKWSATNGAITTLVSSGLSFPEGVAVDGAGNVYIADYGNNAIKEWSFASHNITTLVSGLKGPAGVAVDSIGNVYIADSGNNAIKEWNVANSNVTTLVTSGLNMPTGVAVDGSGNVFIADQGNGAIKMWTAASNTVATLVFSEWSYVPHDVAVDGVGNVYITGTSTILELPHALVDPTAKVETAFAGSDTLPVVLPATENLTGPFAPVSDSPWLTIGAVSNGVVGFAFTATTTNRTANISLLGVTIPVTQMGPTFSLALTNLLEGNAAGSDSVALAITPMNFPWTATANATWLHLSAANQSGAGSTNVIFTFEANAGPTRTGTLSIAGQTLTVTQAGATYVAANPVVISSGLDLPNGVAVDGAGNVYIADTYFNEVEEWAAASDTTSTLVSSGLSQPNGVAVDGAGNVYIADTWNAAIREWIAASNTLATLVSSNLYYPTGVAVDSAGNVYIADLGQHMIKKWIASSNTVTTLVSSGLNYPCSVAVDAGGNVYIADELENVIKEWIAASNTVITLVSSGLSNPTGVAVDRAGNVYIADNGNDSIKEWHVANSNVTTLVSADLSAGYFIGVVVDSAGNLFFPDQEDSSIAELLHAFVDPTAKSEAPFAGSDTLPVVLPTTANLTGPFAPISDSAWLTVTGSANDAVSFAFTANNSGSSRTANISLLGHSIPVTQTSSTSSLGCANLIEGNLAGIDSVVLAVTPINFPWTAAANDSWLHLSATNQRGAGSANVIFTFDANPGATRTGTLTIAGQTLTVTQAGVTYLAANPVTALVSSGLFDPEGVAVDGAGDVYISDTGDQAIKEWTAADNTVRTLVSSGLVYPSGVAVDGVGNVYIADTFDGAIKEWLATSNTVTTLVGSNLSLPFGVALDSAGNAYIADTYNSAVREWEAASNIVTTLVSSGLYLPFGVAVDGAGNVYIADTLNNAIKEWVAASNTVTTLVASGLTQPRGVAVDGAGNVYISDQGDNAIKEWVAASNTVTTLVASELNYPWSVAADGAGNVYIADSGNNAIKERPHAFVDPTAKTETPFAGSDTLPVVLPATANLTGPLAPVSDSAWLTIIGSANGVVSFAFTINTSQSSRTANITLLGRTIPVTQKAAPVTPPNLTALRILGNGGFQFCFTNDQDASFTVLTTTNLALPLTNWTVLGTLTNNGFGQYQFTDPTATNGGERFYRVRSP